MCVSTVHERSVTVDFDRALGLPTAYLEQSPTLPAQFDRPTHTIAKSPPFFAAARLPPLIFLASERGVLWLTVWELSPQDSGGVQRLVVLAAAAADLAAARPRTAAGRRAGSGRVGDARIDHGSGSDERLRASVRRLLSSWHPLAPCRVMNCSCRMLPQRVVEVALLLRVEGRVGLCRVGALVDVLAGLFSAPRLLQSSSRLFATASIKGAEGPHNNVGAMARWSPM